MNLSIVCISLLMFLQTALEKRPPNSPRDTVPSQSSKSPDPLSFYQGNWKVISAAAQVGGRIDYHFSGNKLTISYYSAEREKDGTKNPMRLVSQTDYRVAVSKHGNYLKLTPLPDRDPKKEIIYRVAYEDGNLQLYQPDSKFWTWMLRRVKKKK
jgi:hypothetical protein